MIMAFYYRHGTVVACVVITLLTCGNARATVPAGYVDASTYGYNATDATAALQAAINTGQNVYVPNMGSDWNITPIMLTHSNQTIQFENGTVVAAKADAFTAVDAALFSAGDVSNVTLSGYGATLRMRKSDYLQSPYAPGEWRHGISLGTVSNFKILGLTIKDTGGDGIYVGASQGLYSDKVFIKDVTLDNNYRQGISVISAKDLVIDNAIILNTNGTNPQAGIDFEPNTPDQRLENITVRNSIINTNGTHGILFATNNLADPSQVSGTIENLTLVGNTGSGIKLNQPLPGVTIKDSLFIGNHDSGVDGAPITLDLLLNGPSRNSIDYSGFWANDEATVSGWSKTGPGSLTNVQPLFYSTDATNPYFMFLDPSVSSQIALGASDGGYMGARPVFAVPEPGTMGVAAFGLIAWLGRRRSI
jgi:hypothetical protein